MAGAAVQRGDRDGAGQVPAAVLVVEAVVGEAGEDLRWAVRGVVAGVVFVADEAVGEGEIEPGLVGGVGVEGEVVGVSEGDAEAGVSVGVVPFSSASEAWAMRARLRCFSMAWRAWTGWWERMAR